MRLLSIVQHQADWRTSTYSQGTSGNCVEVRLVEAGSGQQVATAGRVAGERHPRASLRG